MWGGVKQGPSTRRRAGGAAAVVQAVAPCAVVLEGRPHCACTIACTTQSEGACTPDSRRQRGTGDRQSKRRLPRRRPCARASDPPVAAITAPGPVPAPAAEQSHNPRAEQPATMPKPALHDQLDIVIPTIRALTFLEEW